MVRGLRRRRLELEILLSPRSETTGAELAAEDPQVRRATSNAAVVEGSEIIVLAMRPPQLREAVEGLPFRVGQVVVSCLANTPRDEVAALVAPASTCRIIPLPTIEHGTGPLVLHPDLPAVHELFDGLGEFIAAPTESEFCAYSAASGTMSTFYAVQAVISRWLMAQGASRAWAENYVRSMQQALAQTGAARQGASEDLVAEHETRGGINERVRLRLAHAGWFDALGSALDGLANIGGGELEPDRQTMPPKAS